MSTFHYQVHHYWNWGDLEDASLTVDYVSDGAPDDSEIRGVPEIEILIFAKLVSVNYQLS